MWGLMWTDAWTFTLLLLLLSGQSNITNTLILGLQLAISYDTKQQSSGLSSLNIEVLNALHGQKDSLQDSREDMQ
jgi:hypothetical protein